MSFCELLKNNKCSLNGGVKIETVSSLLAALKECTRSRDLARGINLHSQAADSGLLSNAYIFSSLINMYAKCGSMPEAQTLFDAFPFDRTVVSWNSIIQGYVDNGQSDLALQLFDGLQLQSRKIIPNPRTFMAALSACAALAAKQPMHRKEKFLEKGRSIHNAAVVRGCCDMFVESRLIDLYAKCGSMREARCVFDGMNRRDVVSWTAVLQGYADNGQGMIALELFETMRDSCIPNARTYVAVLTACSTVSAEATSADGRRRCIERLDAVHLQAVEDRCSGDLFVQNCLVDAYAKCRSMSCSRRVFDGMTRRDVVSWTALLRGYVGCSESEQALEMFDLMESDQIECLPDARTYVVALAACVELAGASASTTTTKEDLIKWLTKGRSLHRQAVRNCVCDNYVENKLVNMYSKCASMVEAQGVFDRMLVPDVISWNSLILGYVENGESKLALGFLDDMKAAGCERDARSFIAALTACGSLLEIDIGRMFHAEICRFGLDVDAAVADCLMDFYGKCGEVVRARQIFETNVLNYNNVDSWNALMFAYSQQGDVREVLELFDQGMRDECVLPNQVTFAHVLAACSHAGLADKGKEVLQAMQFRYGVKPDLNHFTCVIDSLARSSHLDEAMQMLRSLHMEADAVTWTAVLSACALLKSDRTKLEMNTQASTTLQ